MSGLEKIPGRSYEVLDLAPLDQARPKEILKDGGRVSIEAHDQFFVERYRALKRLIRDTHPDRRKFTRVSFDGKRFYPATYLSVPNTSQPFLAAREKLVKFLKEEAIFYQALNLPFPIEVKEKIEIEKEENNEPIIPSTCWCGREFVPWRLKYNELSKTCCTAHATIRRAATKIGMTPHQYIRSRKDRA